MATHLYIGVDGGASRVRARIRDDQGRRLGESEGGPANVWVDLDGATRNIVDTCRAAARAGGLGEGDLGRLHAGLGLAGAVTESQRELVRRQPFPFASFVVDNDAYAACLGAHRGGDGAILILGTGSCGLAVVGGTRTNVGGWGQVISDDASGGLLGRATLRRCLWALEGVIAHSPFSREVAAEFAHDSGRMAEWAKHATPADFARYAPRVFDQADRRDPIAVAIVREAAEAAALMVERLLAAGAPTVCLVGGLAGAFSPWLPPPLRARLSEPDADAVDGAILMAQQARHRNPAAASHG
jgi:glucosamine kinase